VFVVPSITQIIQSIGPFANGLTAQKWKCECFVPQMIPDNIQNETHEIMPSVVRKRYLLLMK
jgi:hypothetical protein